MCQQFSLTQCITEPTHFTENSSSIIDIILVSKSELLVNSGVGEPFLDQNIRYHCPVFGIFNHTKARFKSYRRQVWNYDTRNYDKLREMANSNDWNASINDDVNIYTENITNCITNMSRECIYNKTITVKPNEPNWITTDIKRNIRKRKRAYKKAKRTNLPRHWESI